MELWEALRNRRSIRKYKSDPVDKETLRKLVDAARLAPNNGNSQPWEFVFVCDPDLVEEVSVIVRNVHETYFSSARIDALSDERLEKTVLLYSGMEKVPVYLLVCLNQKTNQLHPEYAEWNTLWNNHSIGAALNNLMLAAVEEGLGTCWLGTPGWKEDKLKELLKIPEHIKIVAVTPVGYPDESPKARPRKHVEEIAHFDKW